MAITEIKAAENNTVNAAAPFNFAGMFGQPAPGLCRIGANGKLAIRTKDGYKSYDVSTGNLVNVGQFCLDAGAELFFVVPCNKVKTGDVIIVKGGPRCVVSKDDASIKVFNYENGNLEEIVPEKHIFMGNTYFYGKIVSPFLKGEKGGFKNILKFMLFSKLANGGSFGTDANGLLPLMLLGGSEAKSMLPLMLLQQGGNGGMNGLLPLMLLSDGGVDNLFDGLMDGGFDGLFDDEEEKPKKPAKKDAE
jgi:hypothetical protein